MKEKKIIWIDFENAPHVWVMSPIIDCLTKEKCSILLTARDFSYTLDLCKRIGYDVQSVGMSGSGKTNINKIARILERSIRLFIKMWKIRKRTIIALSHGSRSQIIAAHMLGIPSVILDDYEHSNQSFICLIDHLLVPFPIPKSVWGKYSEKILHYPGLKEEIYLCDFNDPEDGIEELKNINKIKVLLRPESRFAHYRSSFSQKLQDAILDYFTGYAEILMVLLPRDPVQAQGLEKMCRKRNISYWIPDNVLNGPTLISAMDLVLSGGGTMTREAAVLGVPSYSFFAGKWGAVDRYLQKQGKIIRIASLEDVNSIDIAKREKKHEVVSKDAVNFINDFIKNRILH